MELQGHRDQLVLLARLVLRVHQELLEHLELKVSKVSLVQLVLRVHKDLQELLEMTVLFFVVGAVGFSLETHIGARFPQTWEFYAISACLFIVLGFPGFIVRYLRKPHG